MARFVIGNVMTQETMGRTDAHDREITAIDIVLEPDQTMVARAKAANARLLENFPAGFRLDETHHPHISIFGGFVPTADLPTAYDLAGRILAKENYTAWELTAFNYYYIPMGPVDLGGIVVEPTSDLLRLQQELIDAVGHLRVKTATAAAFYTTPAEPDIHPAVIDAVTAFDEQAGKNFSPHVTIGLGVAAFLDAMLAEPFASFTFSPASASVCQFGDFGAARKRLMVLPA